MLTLKTTPFHARTSALMQGNQWRRWSGHTVASVYELTIDRELMAIRNAVVLIDVSPLFKYHVRGSDALAFLNRLVTRDLSKMEVGHMSYTPWCNAAGKVVDDGTVAKLAPDLYRLTAAESNWRWLHDAAPGFDVEIEDVSDDLAALAVQGPKSRALLESLSGADLANVGYHRFTTITIAGVSIVASRTGYTGDLGYELWIPKNEALRVWDALVERGRAYALQAAGIWAMDVARIEAGLIMLDVDYTPAPKAATSAQASSPFELGLGWAVSFKKGAFIGKKALAEEKERGSSLTLVGLVPPFPFVPWREVVPIFGEQGQVGYATCGTWSPTIKKYIVLAQVAPASAAPGTRLSIDLMVDRSRRSFDAIVTAIPFFNPPRKRA